MHAGKHQNFVQVDFNTLAIKVSYNMILSLQMGIIKHTQSTQNNKFYNISEKKLRMKFIIKVSTSCHYPFWRKWSDMFNVLKIGTWYFLWNILRKSVATFFVFCCEPKHLIILWRSSHVHCYLFNEISCKYSVLQLSCSSIFSAFFVVGISWINEIIWQPILVLIKCKHSQSESGKMCSEK